VGLGLSYDGDDCGASWGAEIAIDALLLDTPKNRYLPNGHNYQRPNCLFTFQETAGCFTRSR
jgi:hypothetical protein